MKRVKYSDENNGKKAVATVKDFSNGQKGEKEKDVDYDYEWDAIETEQELKDKFSIANLIALANARNKASANAAARIEAIKPYQQDPNSQDAVAERMIKDALKLPGMTEELARKMVTGMLAQAGKQPVKA